MKAFIRSLCLAALLLVGTAPFTFAQDVSTGTIEGYQPKEGTMTIKSDQTHGLITFFGIDKADIFTADGKSMLISNLPLGSKVTVQYAVRGDRWYISKVILPAEPKAVVPGSISINAEPSNSRAAVLAREGDITKSADIKQSKVEPLRRQ